MAIVVQVAAEIATQVAARTIVYARVRVVFKGKTWLPGEVGGVDALPDEIPPELAVVLPPFGPIESLFAVGVATQMASVLNAVSDGVRKVFRGANSPCAECLMRSALPQQPQRRRMKLVRSRD